MGDKTPESLLCSASRMVRAVTPDTEPWDYGWCSEDYRRSGSAALSGPAGPVTITDVGLGDYETAVRRLLTEGAVRDRWDAEQFWSIVASVVVAAATARDPEALISTSLRKLREAAPSLVVLPMANVTWESAPQPVTDGVIGRLDDEFRTAVGALAGRRGDLMSSDADEWIAWQTGASTVSREVVVAACWVPGQMMAATNQAEGWIEDVCALALLFESDLSGKDLWSLRGTHNRPGVRGLVPDRPTLERLLTDQAHGAFELTSQPFVASTTFGTRRGVQWYSASPVPLDVLLTGSTLDRVEGAMRADAIARRLRVAARWYADAHWARDRDDAVLALGVALDALVGSQGALPGRVMAQRFAHLERDPALRATKQARYHEVYKVRSAVAHGGQPSRLAEDGFVRAMAADIHWAAERLLALGTRFPMIGDADIDATFDALALGSLAW